MQCFNKRHTLDTESVAAIIWVNTLFFAVAPSL